MLHPLPGAHQDTLLRPRVPAAGRVEGNRTLPYLSAVCLLIPLFCLQLPELSGGHFPMLFNCFH